MLAEAEEAGFGVGVCCAPVDERDDCQSFDNRTRFSSQEDMKEALACSGKRPKSLGAPANIQCGQE